MKNLFVTILFLTVEVIHQGQCDTNSPIIIREPKSSFTLGPCTWVLDRECPDEDVNFYLFTRNNMRDRELVHIDATREKSNLSSSNFNPIFPTKIIIHGYNADMFLGPLIEMKDEYLQIQDYNIFFVDYSNLALAPCYFSAVHNIRHVGACIAQLIERILEEGSSDVHIIGFSLGAQVTNYVSQSMGSFVIPRITGLDPAMPLFIFSSKENKLDPSDAAFVDIIHTNALIQGKIERCGHVDFYMNGGIIQPGCSEGGENAFACSHHRAPDYFAESIRSYKGFWGWQCSSYISYLLGMCPPTNYLVLAGEHCNSQSKGMYLITTSNRSPFALGKWTDSTKIDEHMSVPFKKFNPTLRGIDQWGKLDSSFNNIKHFPTPYPQDPNGDGWPYFGLMGPSEIFDEVHETDDQPFAQLTEKNEKNNKSSFNSFEKNTDRLTNDINSSFTKKNFNRQLFLSMYKRNLTLGIKPSSDNFLNFPQIEN